MDRQLYKVSKMMEVCTFSALPLSQIRRRKTLFLAHSLFIFRHIFISDLQYINTSEEIVAYNTNIFMNNKL